MDIIRFYCYKDGKLTFITCIASIEDERRTGETRAVVDTIGVSMGFRV